MWRRKRSVEYQFGEAMQAHAAAHHLTLDADQQVLIAHLAQLVEGFLAGAPPFDGLYVWGRPGRGKSFIVDYLFATAPIAGKKRVHFHAFFRDLHRQMAVTGKSLEQVLATELKGCELLCFDEFHLNDIGDAMLIKQLLEQVFQRRMLLIATSNQPPDGLLANPLYHARFLPGIALIKQHMDVVSLNGETDYRTHQSETHGDFSQGGYLLPGTSAQRDALQLPSPAAEPTPVPVGSRTLFTLSPPDAFLHFAFAALCDAPTAIMDYLTLCETYHQWVIEDLPPLGTVSPAVQQRFINVIDVLYEQQCRLYITSTCPLAQLGEGVELTDIQRTLSRLSQLPLLTA